MRLISLCPSNTELIAYLGLTDQLIGVDDFSDWPEQIQNLPRLGPDLSIDMDKVEQLQPDLVLASLSVPGMEKNIEALKERKIPYVVFNPQTLQHIADDLLTLGKLTGQEKKAQAIINDYNNILHSYAEIANSIDTKTKLYWEWWPKPIFTPGGTNWLTEISVLAGGENVFADHSLASIQTNWAEVLNKEPDTICLVWVGIEEKNMKPEIIKKRDKAKSLKCIRENQIYVLEESLYCRPSPRLLHGLNKLASLLHPTKFPAVSEQDPLLK
jgi:iron complex transport system substrate-binding protein